MAMRCIKGANNINKMTELNEMESGGTADALSNLRARADDPLRPFQFPATVPSGSGLMTGASLSNILDSACSDDQWRSSSLNGTDYQSSVFDSPDKSSTDELDLSLQSLHFNVGPQPSAAASSSAGTVAAQSIPLTPDDLPVINPWDEYWKSQQKPTPSKTLTPTPAVATIQQAPPQPPSHTHSKTTNTGAIAKKKFPSLVDTIKSHLAASQALAQLQSQATPTSKPPPPPPPSTPHNTSGQSLLASDEAMPKELQILLTLGYPLNESLEALRVHNMQLSSAIELLKAWQTMKLINQQSLLVNKALQKMQKKQVPVMSNHFYEFLLEIKRCTMDGYLDIELLDQPMSPQALGLVLQLVKDVKRMRAVQKMALHRGQVLNFTPVHDLKKKLEMLRKEIRIEQQSFMAWRPQDGQITLGTGIVMTSTSNTNTTTTSSSSPSNGHNHD